MGAESSLSQRSLITRNNTPLCGTNFRADFFLLNQGGDGAKNENDGFANISRLKRLPDVDASLDVSSALSPLSGRSSSSL